MSILLKTNPFEARAGESQTFRERGLRGAKVRTGERAFIWTAEKNGGLGLMGNGVVVSSSAHQFTVQIDSHLDRPLMTNDDLRAHRDDTSDVILHGIAGIYHYSPLHFRELTSAEEAYLERLFG